eukprot:3862185-Prymnesium_polylepis.1
MRWTANPWPACGTVRKHCHPVRMNYPSVCRTLEMSGFGEQPQDIASIDNASKVKSDVACGRVRSCDEGASGMLCGCRTVVFENGTCALGLGAQATR